MYLNSVIQYTLVLVSNLFPKSPPQTEDKPSQFLQVGRLPALGYNTWNAYWCNINESIVLDNALFIKSSGLQDAGYNYINIDDCWMNNKRSSKGYLIADSKRFPSGIPKLAENLHSLGFQFGIYESAGQITCQGLPGSIQHEEQDAGLFASWGVDYLKYDNCGGGEPNDSHSRMKRMRDALLKQDRPILFALCQGGVDSVWEWGNKTGHSWRISGDIWPEWDRIMHIASIQARTWDYTGPYGYNDMDMLEVGNKGLTLEEQRTHFNLWAISKSPLLIGTHLPSISSKELEILLNNEILAINQDPLSIAVRPFPHRHPHSASADSLVQQNSGNDDLHLAASFGDVSQWYGPLSTAETVVMAINTSRRPTNILLQWRRIPAFERSKASAFKFRDVTSGTGGWQGWSSVGIAVGGVEPHGSFVLIVSEMEEVPDGTSDVEYIDIMYDKV